MQQTVAQLAAWCGAPGVGEGTAALGLMLAGVAASPLHCAPMCGGFVLGQVSDRLARLPAARLGQCQRLRAAALAPYHLGRLTTYASLGFLAGGGMAFDRLGGSAGVFLLAGAVLLALQATHRLGRGFRLPVPRVLAGRSPDGYPLGVALGFLPCGLVYAALATAAAIASPLYGAVAMLCFGLGTVPALIAVGWFGASAGVRFARGVARITPVLLLCNAGLMAALGLRALFGG